MDEQKPSPALDFWDAFKRAVSLSKIADAGSGNAVPFSSSAVGPITAAIGAATGIAGKLGNPEPQFESRLRFGIDPKACASRAILAESAFQTVLTLPHDWVQQFELFEQMQRFYVDIQPRLAPIATKLGAIMIKTVLRMGKDLADTSSPDFDSEFYSQVGGSLRVTESFDTETENFIQLLSYTAMERTGQEEFSLFIKAVASSASKAGSPDVKSIIKTRNDPANSSSTQSSSDERVMSQYMEAFCVRAFLGEAALQTFVTALPRDSDEEIEVIINLIDGVKSIALPILELASDIMKDIQSQYPNSPSSEAPFPEPIAGPIKKPKPSLQDVLGGMGTDEEARW